MKNPPIELRQVCPPYNLLAPWEQLLAALLPLACNFYACPRSAVLKSKCQTFKRALSLCRKQRRQRAEAEEAEEGSPWQSIYACLQLFETLASSFPEQVSPSGPSCISLASIHLQP